MFVLYTAILLMIVICLETYFVSSIRNEQMEQSTSNVRIAEMEASNYIQQLYSNAGNIEYSAYTVDTSITFDFVIGAYASVLSSASSDLGMTLSAVDSSVLLPMASPRSFISCVRVNGSGDLSTSQQNELIGWLYDNQDTSVFYLKFTASSDYQSIEKVIPVTFPASGLVISVTGVSLDQDSVII